MTEAEKGQMGVVGWIAAAVVLLAIVALMLFGCADKKTYHSVIEQILPVEKCPKPLCLHGDKCEPCGKGDDGD